MPNSASSLTSTGGMTGSKPCPRSTSSTQRTSASSRNTRSPFRYAKREPDDLRARLHVDHRAGQLEVIAALGRDTQPHSRSDVVLVGGGRVGRVRQRRLQRVELLLEPRDLGLELLDPRAHRLHRGDRLRRVGARALGLADRLRAGVALGLRLLELGPQRVQALAQRPAPRAAARRSRRARRASAARTGSGSRLIARRSSIALRGGAVGGRRPVWPGRVSTSVPEFSATNSASSLGLLADDDVLRHRARTRSRRCGSRTATQFAGHLALVEVRPVLVLAGPDVGRRALGAGHAERVAARAALVEELGGGAARSSGDGDPLLTAGGDDAARSRRADVAISSARRALVIGCDSIGERCPRTRTSLAARRRAPSRSPAAATPGRPCASATTSFTVTLDDYLIRPQELRVPEGQAADRHASPTAAGSATRSGSAARDRNVLALHDDPAGRDARRAVPARRRGNYTMYCVLANHEELGMHGTLTVG